MQESFHLPGLKHTLALIIAAFLSWGPLMAVPREAHAQIPEPKCVCAECHRPCGSGHAPGCQYYNGGSGDGSKSSGGGLTSAPILVAPVGVAAGVLGGVVWWVKEMAGKYPGQSFFSSYHRFCTVEDDPTWASGAFSFGMHIGAAPWLVLYLVTGPIRAGIVAVGKALNRPAKPPAPKPPHPDIAVYELIARNYAALGEITEQELRKAQGNVDAARMRRTDLLDEHVAARPELMEIRDREGIDAARARAEKQLDAWAKARAEKQKLSMTLIRGIRDKDTEIQAAIDQFNPLSFLDSRLDDTVDRLDKVLANPRLSQDVRDSLTREQQVAKLVKHGKTAYDIGANLKELKDSYENARDVGKDASEWIQDRRARESMWRLQLKLLTVPLSKVAGGVVAKTETAIDVAYALTVAVKLGRLIDADMATLDKLRTASMFQDVAADNWARVNQAVKAAEAAREPIVQRGERYLKLQKENQAHADALR
ncbi:hypothetical protein KJ975_08280 [Myxococcota bacterium]|nr:hypothetical protein [Myxococcota bacterium]